VKQSSTKVGERKGNKIGEFGKKREKALCGQGKLGRARKYLEIGSKKLKELGKKKIKGS
jgi:hypothetical protein